MNAPNGEQVKWLPGRRRQYSSPGTHGGGQVTASFSRSLDHTRTFCFMPIHAEHRERSLFLSIWWRNEPHIYADDGASWWLMCADCSTALEVWETAQDTASCADAWMLNKWVIKRKEDKKLETFLCWWCAWRQKSGGEKERAREGPKLPVTSISNASQCKT